MKIGIDVGSTTIKCVVLDDFGRIVYERYERHGSFVIAKAGELLVEVRDRVLAGRTGFLAVSGSAGMGMAEECALPFVQEVYATRLALAKLLPDTDVAIELGGEDAKILFLTGGLEVRMNGSCAGGTGAFIDQMATLLEMSPDDLDKSALCANQIYTIASRCGVFAKSDIQPLLNQGAPHEDIAASIFSAVVNQTVAGLAQGRPIAGNVVYLGGPLTYFSALRSSFDKTLGQTGNCPSHSLYYVAIGAALSAEEPVDLDAAVANLSALAFKRQYRSLAPLFESREAYAAFAARHNRASTPTADLNTCEGPVFLGVDAGSTTVKIAVIDKQGCLLESLYRPNKGNPIETVRQFLLDFRTRFPNLSFGGATATGYGEDLIARAFSFDCGIVETTAHLAAAQRFCPDVEFIIDIGGQDIKCFKIRNGVIDSLFLNEACSSGCGSFLQTFANALGYSVEEFARLGLFADRPVDLGSRCTVFMNSSVKQAQKDGASIENISAGLSISVVKNALYKVIRATSPEELGNRVMVQGGTFLNDAVLRAFETELGIEVIRPGISGLMGAFGAALWSLEHAESESSLLSREKLQNFRHEVKSTRCNLCENRCHLTVNRFDNSRSLISGNRCERPVTRGTAADGDALNLYADKLALLKSYKPIGSGERGTLGIPMGLNMFELLPFWHALFTRLGFHVVTSPLSDRDLYLLGQATIPSDTVCFPAKLMHGHVQALINAGAETIFYPCMSYNFDEKLGSNHYNCPVVAYYAEVIGANMHDVVKTRFIKDYLGPHRRREFPSKLTAVLKKHFLNITGKEVADACDDAYREQEVYLVRVRERASQIIEEARQKGMPIIVLAGRPYHIDPETNHGIDRLVRSLGAAVISEEALSHLVDRVEVDVLNQWTYHARLYAAARYLKDQPDMHLVQLVSFGCGLDAITADEVRSLLESEGRLYTQLKIDEIANLGAVKIRLRSLFSALEQQKETCHKR